MLLKISENTIHAGLEILIASVSIPKNMTNYSYMDFNLK
jgi:hypothetical protein